MRPVEPPQRSTALVRFFRWIGIAGDQDHYRRGRHCGFWAQREAGAAPPPVQRPLQPTCNSPRERSLVGDSL